MHGLVNRAIQAFTRDTQGASCWAAVAARVGAPEAGFEPMLAYPPDMTQAMLAALAERLGVPVTAVLEDLGTYLVADPRRSALRRLLRFGGAAFPDFLHSLAELPARVRLALPDLALPGMAVTEDRTGVFRLAIAPGLHGSGHVALGLVRAMADDYGTLALFDLAERRDGGAVLTVRLVDTDHAVGRGFVLGLSDALSG